MMDSWMVQESEPKHTARDFNPGVPVMGNQQTHNPYANNHTKENYEKYGWLFGYKG